jgi:hypothetical protein
MSDFTPARTGIADIWGPLNRRVEEDFYLRENGTATIPSSREDSGNQESVVYLGINSAARETEKRAFAGQKNATLVTGSGENEEMQGKTMAADGETVLDLSKEEDVKRFLRESGAGAVRKDEDGNPLETTREAMARMENLEDLFLGSKHESGIRLHGLDPNIRDEMAQFVQVLQKVEQGEMSMDRLVMSGHHTESGQRVYSEHGGGGVDFYQMERLMAQFPQARAGVEDLMLSACNTLNTPHAEQTYKDIFPELSTVWGYKDGQSPAYNQGSVGHIVNFLQASQGDRPALVPATARATGVNAYAKMYED